MKMSSSCHSKAVFVPQNSFNEYICSIVLYFISNSPKRIYSIIICCITYQHINHVQLRAAFIADESHKPVTSTLFCVHCYISSFSYMFGTCATKTPFLNDKMCAVLLLLLFMYLYSSLVVLQREPQMSYCICMSLSLLWIILTLKH